MDKQRSNIKKLMIEYRTTLWRKSVHETVPHVSHNVAEACKEQMNLIKTLVEKLWERRLLGEKMYWIIYSTYMTEHQPGDVDDILNEIATQYQRIPRRTYFRLRKRALELLDKYVAEFV